MQPTGGIKLFSRVTGLVTFIVIFFLAFLFYKERTLSFDIALQDYFIIIRKTWFIYLIRPGDALHEIPPLVCRWLNCPIKEILLAHSVGFAAFYFIFFLLIGFHLKQHWVALTYILFLVLTVNDTFYWIPSEIPQGIAFLMLYYAWLEKKKAIDINRRPLLHFLIVLWIQFYHPLMIAPILFVVLYVVNKQYQLSVKAHIKPIAIVLISFAIRVYAGTFFWYENEKMNFLPALKSNWANFFSLPSTQKLFHFSGTDYLVYWLVLGVTLLMLLLVRRFYLAALLSAFTAGYLFLICVAGPYSDKFYLENMMYPISVFALLPFTDHFLKKIIVIKQGFLAMIILIMAVRLTFIYQAHQPYTARLNWYSEKLRAMEANGQDRLLIYAKDVPADKMIMTWASGYESLLLSAIDGPDKAKAIVISDDFSRWESVFKSDSLLLPYEANKISDEVKQRYFNMKPGNYVYQNK